MGETEVVSKAESSNSDSPLREPAGIHHDHPATDDPVAKVVRKKQHGESTKEGHWSKVSSQLASPRKISCNMLYLIATI